MLKSWLGFFFFLPIVTLAQEDGQNFGIQFDKNLSWQQLLLKAKQKHKYIFVDCYATWCAPCKKMELEVFPQKEVGEYMNSHFISVRVQMDTSKYDSEYTRNWYNDAHSLERQFKVSAFPTYLFF